LLPDLISTGGYTDIVIGVQKNSVRDGKHLAAPRIDGLNILVYLKIRVNNGIASLVSFIIVSMTDSCGLMV